MYFVIKSSGAVDTGGGDFRLGDNYYKTIEYKELTQRIEELEDFIQGSKEESKKLNL